jgi:hypothetical protein
MQQKPLSAIRSTMSYGTCSYGWSAVAGFIIGTVIFLAGVAILPGADSTDPGYTYSVLLPMLAVIAGVGVGLALIWAAAFNYFEGRRIQWERELFSGPELPPPLPRPDVPGYDLGVRPKTHAEPRAHNHRAAA